MPFFEEVARRPGIFCQEGAQGKRPGVAGLGNQGRGIGKKSRWQWNRSQLLSHVGARRMYTSISFHGGKGIFLKTGGTSKSRGGGGDSYRGKGANVVGQWKRRNVRKVVGGKMQ